jgi:predicted dienelactone hydrolase
MRLYASVLTIIAAAGVLSAFGAEQPAPARAGSAPGSSSAPAPKPDDNSYKLQAGPFAVRTIKQVVLDDAKRKKQLQLRINFPDAAGPLPVIVFSHGAYGSKDNYLMLTEHWTSHGYVTIQANHSDSAALGMRVGDPATFRDWQSRPGDVSLIIDSLDELQRMQPDLKGKLDPRHIGVGGHSFGANTAQLIGGAKAFLSGGTKSFADQRVTAVLLMSGQGPGEMLTETSWAEFKCPMMVMTGSRDGPTRTGQPAEWRKKPYELSPPGNKYLFWVEGLDHGYGGIPGGTGNPKNKPNADHIAYTKIATTAFWDAYLKEDKTARTYLESNRLSTFSHGDVKLEHK